MTTWQPRTKTDYALVAADAAVKWWESKRPEGWTVYKHLGNPMEGLTDEIDRALAFAASNWAALYWGVIKQYTPSDPRPSRYVDCVVCGKNVAVAKSGYTWRHSGPDGIRHRVWVPDEIA